MPTKSEDVRLKNVLKEHDAEKCICGHKIGWGDLAWNEGQTEAGTPCSSVYIECQACLTELAWIHSWKWFTEDEDYKIDRLLTILEQDWRKN